MKRKPYFVLATVLVSTACTSMTPRTQVAKTAPDALPPELYALAAPGQDIASARLLPQDNCYWYEHRGQVETTLLPLTTADGRPICRQPRA